MYLLSMDIEAFLDANPFYKYFLLFCVFLPLAKKFFDWLIKVYVEYKDDIKH